MFYILKMNVSLKQIKLFSVIAQQGTISKAAEVLFMSKPAVSISLSELEKQIGFPLFERYKGRLILNTAGKAALPLAVEIIDRFHEIQQIGRSPMPTTIKIGASHTIGNHMAPFIISEFQSTSPGSKLALEILNTKEIVSLLTAFQIDIGLVEGKVYSSTLVVSNWFLDEMMIICSTSHPLAVSQNKIQLSELSEYAWILRETGSGTRAFFDMYVASQLSKIEIAFEMSSLSAIINAVIANLGIACISKTVLKPYIDSQQLKIVDISLPSRQCSIIYPKNKYYSAQLNTFIEFCQHWQPTEKTHLTV